MSSPQRPVRVPVTLAVGQNNPKDVAVFMMPPDSSPPTRAEIAQILRAVADKFDVVPDGVQVPAVVTVLQRP